MQSAISGVSGLCEMNIATKIQLRDNVLQSIFSHGYIQFSDEFSRDAEQTEREREKETERERERERERD